MEIWSAYTSVHSMDPVEARRIFSEGLHAVPQRISVIDQERAELMRAVGLRAS